MKNHDSYICMEMEYVSPFFRFSLLSMLEGCTEARFNLAYPGIFPEFKKWTKCTIRKAT
jgi:hypothetical protein